MPHVRSVEAGEVFRVGGGGRPDVAAFDVADHVEAVFTRILAGHRIAVDARRPERLIHRNLWFDGGDDVGDGVDDGAVEFEVGGGRAGRGEVVVIVFDVFSGFDGVGAHDLRRHERRSWVEAHDAGVLFGFDGFNEMVHTAPSSVSPALCAGCMLGSVQRVQAGEHEP